VPERELECSGLDVHPVPAAYLLEVASLGRPLLARRRVVEEGLAKRSARMPLLKTPPMMILTRERSEKDESLSELLLFELHHRDSARGTQDDRQLWHTSGSRALLDRSKSVVRRVLRRALYALPSRSRSRLASILPEFLVVPAMGGSTYFDRLYGGSDTDPYGFDTHPEERLKFTRTLDLCGLGPFERALEIGCSIGTFTELLAPRCTSLLATDISEQAVRTAVGRLGAFPQVTCEVRDLRHGFPEGSFDLIVASDVFYHWTIDTIIDVLRHIEQGLAPGGTLVTLHYVPQTDLLLNGNEVHDLLTQESRLDHVFTELTEFGDGRKYRVDVFARPTRGANAPRQQSFPA
jgi:SAM-dependent methyltransferase